MSQLVEVRGRRYVVMLVLPLQVQHKVVLSDHKASRLNKQLSQQSEENGSGDGNGVVGSRFTPQLRPFTDIAGYSGVSWVEVVSVTDTHSICSTPLNCSSTFSRCLSVGRTPTG